MIVRQFLLWARQATPGHRAEAVAALARAYLYSDLTPDDRWEAEAALTAMLDDGSPVVRRAMAESLADSPDAPRHIIVALAGDGAEIATLVLARSPVLADADLVDCAALGDEPIQCAVAGRPWLSRSASAALAEIGCAPALVALAGNPGAEIAEFSYARMVARFGDVPELREALLGRPDLPVETAQAIAAALAASLGRFVESCGWLTGERSGRVVREARERTTVALSSGVGPDDSERLVEHLRVSGQLTPALILRAILSGGTVFTAAAFAQLAGYPRARSAAILADARGGAFRALYGRAGLPDTLRPAFEAALAAAAALRGAEADGRSLSRAVIARALSTCEDLPLDDSGRLVAMLRRFEMEAARDDARRITADLADAAADAFAEARADAVLVEPRGARALAA